MAELPRPEVNVTTRETDVGHEVDLVVSREGKARSYTGGGAGSPLNGAIKDVVEKLLNDGHTAEWLPGKKDG